MYHVWLFHGSSCQKAWPRQDDTSPLHSSQEDSCSKIAGIRWCTGPNLDRSGHRNGSGSAAKNCERQENPIPEEKEANQTEEEQSITAGSARCFAHRARPNQTPPAGGRQTMATIDLIRPILWRNLTSLRSALAFTHNPEQHPESPQKIFPLHEVGYERPRLETSSSETPHLRRNL